jgi:hypothetical protein
MDRHESATALARALLALARAGATGGLDVLARGRSAEIAFESGFVSSIALRGEDDPCVGDSLFRDGAIDERCHRLALAAGGPSGKVGAWLVASGATTEGALDAALDTQIRRRLARVFAWEGIDLAFRATVPVETSERARSPRPAATLVLEAMRSALAGEPLVVVRKRLGDGLLVMTPLGRQLLDFAELLDEERAFAPLLERGASVDMLLGAAGGRSRAMRGLLALRLLGAAAPPSPGGKAYRLLLRKRRQIRMAADPSSLLEIPYGSAPGEARRALRQLAKDVHPDRFQDAAHPAVREASAEVLAALVAAEAAVSGR